MNVQQQGFPNMSTPIADVTTGRLVQPWYNLLISLWNRTGGGQGSSSSNPATIVAPVGQILLGQQLASPIILRSGPSANFTDTFDSAVNYLTALGNSYVGEINQLTIINMTPYSESISPGSGFSFMGNLVSDMFVIPANTQKIFSVQVTNVRTPAVTVYG